MAGLPRRFLFSQLSAFMAFNIGLIGTALLISKMQPFGTRGNLGMAVGMVASFTVAFLSMKGWGRVLVRLGVLSKEEGVGYPTSTPWLEKRKPGPMAISEFVTKHLAPSPNAENDLVGLLDGEWIVFRNRTLAKQIKTYAFVQGVLFFALMIPSLTKGPRPFPWSSWATIAGITLIPFIISRIQEWKNGQLYISNRRLLFVKHGRDIIESFEFSELPPVKFEIIKNDGKHVFSFIEIPTGRVVPLIRVPVSV